MKVSELFKEQADLDNYIMEKLKTRGIEIENVNELLSYRLVALMTELGEVEAAPQEEKLEEYIDVMHFVLSIGNLSNIKIPYATLDFKEVYELSKSDKLEIPKLVALKHFIVKFSNFANSTRAFKYWSTNKQMADALTRNYIELFISFLNIGHSQNFTAKEIEQTYLIKNKVNYQRQDEGY